MTEAEWLACEEPGAMLEELRGRASERKLRLFACACVRRIGSLLTSDLSRMAVEAAERYADGEQTATADEMYSLETRGVEHAKAISLRQWWREWTPSELAEYYAAIAAAECLRWSGLPFAESAAWWVDQACWIATAAAQAVAFSAGANFAETGLMPPTPAGDVERAAQARILQDLFGPIPFKHINLGRLPLPTVVSARARTIYKDRAFDRLPILDDALLDAGCDNPDILAHCRSEGPHVRGCWVVDLLLGKC